MQSWMNEVEDLIRLGRFEDAESKLILLKKISRDQAASFANAARRINRCDLAIKILNPIIRSPYGSAAPATALEKLEYADALRQLGALEEAWNLLSEVSSDEFPKVLLHQAFCLFAQWRYEEAVPLLLKYHALTLADDYANCVAEINLAAAYIAEDQFNLATPLVDSLIEKTKRNNFTLLYGNSLELKALILIDQKNFDQALLILEDSHGLIEKSGKSTLYVEKWQAIAQSLKENKISASLTTVLQKAISMRHWETVRDCELYLAFLRKDKSRFKYLYFGTPFENYRRRILKMAGPDFKISASYVWSSSDEQPPIIFDTLAAQITGLESKVAALPVGQVLHRFFILMAQDFFRPRATLSLFCQLFPDEFVSAVTSVNRVHQIVKRARKWIKTTGLPIQIEELDGSYRLILQKNVGLRVLAEAPELSDKQIEWNLFKSKLSQTVFTIHDVIRLLATSESSARRTISWALRQKLICRSGQGSKTTYSIAV